MRTKDEIEFMRHTLMGIVMDEDAPLIQQALAWEQIECLDWVLGEDSELDNIWDVANVEKNRNN